MSGQAVLEELIHTTIHNGVQYRTNLRGGGDPDAIFIDSEPGRFGKVNYVYELSGDHQGPAILVKLVDVQDVYDEAGWRWTFDQVVWADDGTPFDEVLLDGYSDAIHQDLGIPGAQ